MPTRLPLCSQCQSNLYVRVEWILNGRRVSREYYCGRCHQEWRVEETVAASEGERRSADRRKHARTATKSGT